MDATKPYVLKHGSAHVIGSVFDLFMHKTSAEILLLKSAPSLVLTSYHANFERSDTSAEQNSNE